MKKIKLNLGCGLWLKGGFINVDKFYTEEQLRGKRGAFKQARIEPNAKFVQCDIGKMPFPDEYADYIEMNQVVEHFPMRQMHTYFTEIRRVMKTGGRLVATMPSFNGVIAEWLAMVASPPFDPNAYLDLAEVIYGNQLAEGEMHRTPITPEFISFILTSVGFKNGMVYIAKKYTKVKDIKFLRKNVFHDPEKAVFRNDNIIIDVTK